MPLTYQVRAYSQVPRRLHKLPETGSPAAPAKQQAPELKTAAPYENFRQAVAENDSFKIAFETRHPTLGLLIGAKLVLVMIVARDKQRYDIKFMTA